MNTFVNIKLDGVWLIVEAEIVHPVALGLCVHPSPRTKPGAEPDWWWATDVITGHCYARGESKEEAVNQAIVTIAVQAREAHAEFANALAAQRRIHAVH